MTLARTRGEGCPSSLRMDRYLAGELGPAEVEQLERHLPGCPRCTDAINERRRAHQAFPCELPRPVVERFESRARRPPLASAWRRWAPATLGALGLAFAVLAHLRAEEGDAAPERSKGGARVTLYVQHAEVVRRASEGEPVVPGDAIEVAYSIDHSAYLAVVSLDGAHRASAYYERNGAAVPIVPAYDQPVDRSIVLDGTLGGESIYAIFCDHPFDVAPITSAMQAQPEQLPIAPGCVVDRHTIAKVGR